MDQIYPTLYMIFDHTSSVSGIMKYSLLVDLDHH